jgi:hypothetical protein
LVLFLKNRIWMLLAVLVSVVVLAVPSPLSILPRVHACDSSMWSLSSQAFLVDILNLQTDKRSYAPGDTVIIYGKVRLVQQDTYYQSGCDPPYEQGTPFTDNPDAVAVALKSSLTTDSSGASADGGFSFTFALDQAAKAGTYPFTVTADCPQCASIGQTQGASQDGSFTVQAYHATLTVSDAFAYVGDTVTVSGDAWGAVDPITLTYGVGHTVTVSGPSFSQTITIPPLDEGPATILASQGSPPYITNSVQVDVKWHKLVINAVFDSSKVVQGTAIKITGTITNENDKPQEGIRVGYTITPSGFTQAFGGATSDSTGTFTITLDTTGATPQVYDIAFSTVGGASLSYHDALEKHYPLTVTAPPFVSGDAGSAVEGVVVGGVGGLLGLAAASALPSGAPPVPIPSQSASQSASAPAQPAATPTATDEGESAPEKKNGKAGKSGSGWWQTTKDFVKNYIWNFTKEVAKTPPLTGEALDVLETVAEDPKATVDGARALTHLGGQKDTSFRNALDDM